MFRYAGGVKLKQTCWLEHHTFTYAVVLIYAWMGFVYICLNITFIFILVRTLGHKPSGLRLGKSSSWQQNDIRHFERGHFILRVKGLWSTRGMEIRVTENVFVGSCNLLQYVKYSVCVCVYMYIYTVYIYVCVYICIYVYMYTYIYIYTHTHKCSCLCLWEWKQWADERSPELL